MDNTEHLLYFWTKWFVCLNRSCSQATQAWLLILAIQEFRGNVVLWKYKKFMYYFSFLCKLFISTSTLQCNSNAVHIIIFTIPSSELHFRELCSLKQSFITRLWRISAGRFLPQMLLGVNRHNSSFLVMRLSCHKRILSFVDVYFCTVLFPVPI